MEECINKSYNYFLYEERLKRSLSRKEFARFLNVKPIRYSFIERGYVKPKKNEIELISNSLNIDYSIYLEGINSYPKGLPEKEKTRFFKSLYKMISKPSFKIINIILILLSILSIILCFNLSNNYSKNSRKYMNETYLSVFDGIKELGTPTISLTSNDIKRPEIYINDSINNKFTSIVGSYSQNDVLNIKYTYTKKSSDDKITITSNMKTSLSDKFNLDIKYTNLSDYNTYSVTYYFDNDNNTFVKKEKSVSTTYDSDVQPVINEKIEETIDEFSIEMENLIYERLNINIDFNNDLIINVIKNKSKLLKSIVFLFVGGLTSICLLLSLIYLLIYSFLYGNEENTIRILRNSTTYSELTINKYSKKQRIKKDIKIFPFLPEALLKLLGIILTCAGSIRILLIFLKFLGFFPDSPYIQSLDYELDIYFSIGLFLIFFINFDIFKDDRRSIRNVFLYFIVYIGLFILELIIIFTVKKFAVGRLFFENTNATLPNYFGTICCYFLIMLFLFNNPKWANTNKKLLIFRLFSLIPILTIIVSTYLNYASKMYNWNCPLWFKYLINTGRPQISILCILYLVGLYFLRLTFKMKYGTEACKTLFNGNRYLICKNLLMTNIILIISLMEFILCKNTLAHKFDLGLYPHFIMLAPLMLLYHPHTGGRNKKTDYLILGTYIFFFGLGYFIIGGLLFTLFI